MGDAMSAVARRALRLGAALALLVCAPAQAERLPRIASLNVCTDQLLIALADPAQILALSPYSRDANQSATAAEAQNYPQLSGGAEDVLVLAPDVVVTGLFDRRATREMLKSRGVPLVEFDVVPRSLAEVKDQIRTMGEIARHPDRAAVVIAQLDAAIARARAVTLRRPYRVLPLWRRGWVSGQGSLIGLLFAEAGLNNVASELGIGAGGFASLEAIVSLKPDYLLVSDAANFADDEGSALLLHPALQHFYPPAKRLILPERLTVCGGARLADALDLLVAQLERLKGQSGG
jgi:iron complex transport system substrate-binding protein